MADRTVHGFMRLGRLGGAMMIFLSLLVAPQVHSEVDEAHVSPEVTAAMALMDRFLQAFNDRNPSAWADTIHFPHVRLASGGVSVYEDRQEFIAEMDLESFAKDTGWDHSKWEDMRVIQSAPEKVHIAVTFTRFYSDGRVMGSFDSLYIIENVEGRWGVRARSSFAP